MSAISALERGSAIETLIANSRNHQANLERLQVEVSPGVTPNQISAAFTQVRTFAQETIAHIPPEQKLNKAAALWQVTHRRQNKLTDEQGEMKAEQNQRYNKASAAFALFKDEIVTQLSQLQFKQFKVAGIATPANEYGSPPIEKSVPFLIDLETNPYHPYYGFRSFCVEGQVLGYMGEDEAQLPIATTGRATFSSEPAKTLTATLPNGQSLKVGLLKNYVYADTSFSNTEAELEVTFVTPKGRHKLVPALRYQGQILGEVRDKNAIALLDSQGLHRAGAQFSATLERSFSGSVAIANIDPATIAYGDRFLTEKALLAKQEGRPQQYKFSLNVEANPMAQSENFTNNLSLDPDGDGLTTAQEQSLNTNPYSADTDDDTLTDSQELNQGTDPLVPTPLQDDLFGRLPLSQEYQMDNLIQQQERTEKVASALAAFLKAQRPTHPERFSVEGNTLKFEGKDSTVTWDGETLSLIDKATNQPKMLAQPQSRQGDVTWKALSLPQGSLGLSVGDVEKFTNPQFTQTVKQALLEQGQKTAAISR